MDKFEKYIEEKIDKLYKRTAKEDWTLIDSEVLPLREILNKYLELRQESYLFLLGKLSGLHWVRGFQLYGFDERELEEAITNLEAKIKDVKHD